MNFEFQNSWINFGDQNITIVTAENSSMYHSYAVEGKYNITLYAKTSGLSEVTESILVEIKNNAPQFNISLPTQAYEDEYVNVSVIDLVESDVDKEPGKLTYIYDFADGNQTSCNKSSILHTWKNAGDYSMTITVIDPQGALDQQLEHITIVNKAPEANFTVHTNIPSEFLLESYYATHDFQTDFINLEPKDWDVHDYGGALDKYYKTLKPNGDIITGWDYGEAPPHWSILDEDSPDGLIISEHWPDGIEELDFATFTLGDNVITEIKVRMYGKISDLIYVDAHYRIGTGALSSAKVPIFDLSYGWGYVKWSGLSLTQSDLDDLRIRLYARKIPTVPIGYVYIDTMSVQFTYKPATTVSIENLGEYINNVVKLSDMSQTLQAWMENSFVNQQHGTVEFWVKSNDATNKTWALSFWDSTTMAFSITMDADKWKYSTSGGFNEISELDAPADNTWYWVRVDFCVSGTYLDLNATQFKITINDNQSNVYSFSSINQINKIRFESGISDEGMAWIDAVGYLWDPNYQLGDNEIQSVYYPEKCNVNFYANASSDTKSDINSLRYYWKYGDNNSGFGKFVYHEYKQSGIYNVTLTVKDDNGATDNFSRRVLVHNTYPVVNFTGASINLNEGETLILNVSSIDEITDWAFLEYYWDFNASEFDPFNVSGYELGGWKNAYLFKDDFNGDVGVLIRDPEGAFNSDTISVTISNVAPQAYIWGAHVVANVTFQVFRNSVSKDANFSFSLLEDDELKSETKLNFSGSSENLVYSDKELTIMDLSRNWEVLVNTSSELPADSWFRCYVILEFLNGDQLVITSDKLYGGSYGYWNVSLNPYWYNPIDYTIRVPMTLNASIWDPSMDDISYALEYSVIMVVKINCTDSLPISDSFIIGKSLGDVSYTIDVFSSGDDKYANITATQQFSSGNFDNNVFPVNINFSFTIFPIVDLFELLDVHLDLTELSILGCNESINILEIEVSDDDGGSNEEMIVFLTQDRIAFQNLMPRLECFMPGQEVEANNVTLYLEVTDFDQIYSQYGNNISYFNADDIPTLQDDFNLIEGSSDWEGELTYQNDEYATFTSNFNFDHFDLPSQPDNFTLNDGTSDWSGDLTSINGNYTGFSSEDLGTDYGTVIVRPDADITTSWNEGASTPHWNKIEEVNPDGVAIADTGSTVGSIIDRHSYGNVDIGSVTVTQIKLYVYAKRDSGATAHLKVKYEVGSGWSSLESITISSVYAWRSCTWSGLSLTESQVNQLSVALVAYNIISRYRIPGKVYVDAVYVEISYEMNLGHSLNFTTEFQLDLDEHMAPKDIEYSYKTDITQAIDFKIWNFQTSQWDLIDSANYDSFSNHSFDFSSSHYDGSNTVRLSFYGLNSGNSFDLDLEMLKVRIGNHSLEFISTFQMEDINVLEELKFFKLLYSYKTSYSQLINLSLYNFHSQSWTLIDSSVVGTTFEREKYLISNAAYHNSTYHVLAKIKAESLAPEITLFLDQLRLVYYYANSTYQEDYFLEDVPEQSDFTVYNGTLDTSGDLSSQDDNYTTFTSEAIGFPTLDFSARFHMTNSSSEDYPVYLQLFYSFKSNISTQANISLYNFITQAWDIIDSVNVSISWYTQICRVNISSYFNSSFDMLFRIEATNSSENFQLFLDQLKIDYLFSSFFVTTDFGHESLTQQANPDFEMSSESSTAYYTIFTFASEGEYLITWTVDDENLTAYGGEVIEINNIAPVALIGSFPNQTIEDKEIQFSSDIIIYGSNSTKNDFRYAWSFGDGLYAYTEDPIHAYAEAGVYNISLTVLDCYGNTYTDIKNITILEEAPEIVGPYAFYGVEGQAITLDVDIFDSFLDERDLEYKWYNSSGLFASYKNPSVILQNGTYSYTLNVTDSVGKTTTANISVIVEDAPPVVFISNYMYSGGVVSGTEGFFMGAADDPNELELTAYGYDISEDNNDLDYIWKIFNGNESYTTYDYDGGLESIAKFRVTESAIYRGQVTIESESKRMVANFIINSFIDSNGNAIDDGFEDRLKETNETITSYSDYDNDGYTDLYEIGFVNTSYLDPDTDSDGLYDGVYNETRIGEDTVGTDPLDWDCDNDMLSDGIEVLGWKLTSEMYGEIVVTSDPWNNNSDDDDWSDYEEYYAGTDPRNSDSDNDGAIDSIDPYPMKWDGDDDGLRDGLELQIGTNPNNTDTDQDGISDGEEVLGWAFKTDPLSADGDHDFLADTAEMQNYKVSIDERYDLNESISLSFEVNCEKATAAQIAFLITFGEAINEPENNKTYGIQNVPDLNVSIYKVDDGLLLFNMTTNCTRYFSQVVDIRETMEDHSLDYRGEYMVKINDTSAGCILEQFEMEVCGYLNPNDADFDNDGIMDGVEIGLLVEGVNIINFTDFYEYDNLTVNEKIISNNGYDFKVISGATIISSGSTTATITEGTDYDLEPGQDSTTCYIRITNTRLTGMGRTSGGGDQNNDDFCVRIQNPDNIATSITFERTGTANDDRVTWEILQYIGPSGGANEMIIRSVGTATCSGTTVTCDGSSISTISNPDKVVVFITGQKAADTGRGNWWESLFTAELIGSGPYTPRFTRGKSVDSSDGVSYAVVEFTGYNWRNVQRLEISTECSTAWTTSNYDTTYSDVTIQSEGGVDLLNYTKTFLYQQYRTDNDGTSLDDAGDNVEIISTTHLRIRNSATSGNRYKVCWIIENTQSTGTVMSVEHDWSYKGTGGSEENTWTESISTVASMNTTSVFAQASMDGTGTALPRGSIDYRLTAANTITFKESDNGEEKLVTYSVVQWPTAPIGPIEEPDPTIDEFYLDIPHIGRVYDANLTLKVESEGIPAGMGEVNITLIKEEINCNVDDALLVDYSGEFDDTSAFTFETSLDLSDYLNNNSISEFYGTYKLEITVLSTSISDNFTLSEFYIETDTFIQAEATDTEAWYTNPALADTDNDGWSDYYEIFTTSTNPLSADTDGDGVWDAYDRDPKRNVMIEINPIYGKAVNQYKFQIVIAFSLTGTDENFYIPTPKVKAHEYSSSFWYAYFDGTHGSSTELHYYADVNDDIRVQGNKLDFTIQLWRVDRYFGFIKKCDKKLVNEIDTYKILNVGHSEELKATKYGDSQEIVYKAKINVKTIGVEKANTIAIYEINGTVFNGHYQQQERMNIIQLYVNDTPSANSPFVNGPNNIVIPTSLFTETILNGYIQNERLDETFFYSDDEEIFKFISVEREGNTEQACAEIDFIMIRTDISSEDAEKLLDLILTCVINESLDENNNTITTNATLYAWYSTKINGTSTVMMNLPHSVLGIIPWYCEFSDSPTGPKPKDFDDWFWAPLKAVFKFVGSLVITIVMLPAVIVSLIVAYVVSIILLVLLPIFAYVLWLIIRVALLILAFILLAIHVIAQVSIYLSLGISMLALTAFTGGYCNFSWNFVEFLIEDKLIRLESKVKWVYWDFFAMSFPWVQDNIKINSTTYMTSLKAILKSDSNVEFNELDSTFNQTEAPPTLHCNYDQVDDTTFNFWTVYDDSKGGCGESDSEYGVRLHLIAPNGTALTPYQMSVHPDYLPNPDFKAPVKYNYTIDLSTIFPEQGLWHYYFTCKDNSSEHEPTIMPIGGYFLGPDTSVELPYLFATAVSSDPDDYYCPSGFINDTFTFRTWWGCSIAPANVSLCLIPANKTVGVGVSNTVGIRKFLMSTTEQNPNYSQQVEYNCTVNFQELNYTESELGWFFHYYEAILSDGNKTYLYKVDGTYEEGFDIDFSELTSEDFRQPFVTSFGPKLLDYSFEGDNLPYVIAFPGKHRLLWSENRIEFEVVYLDPYGGYPQEFYPKLIFEEVVTGENITFTTDKYWETSLAQEYGESAVSCVFHINGDDIGPGMWSFRFEAKDSEGNPVPTIYGYERFWMWGSILSILDAFSMNTIYEGYIPIGAFTFAMPFMQKAPYISIAMSFASTLYGLGSAAFNQREYCRQGNFGGLLGQSLALLFISFTTAFTSTSGFLSRLNLKVLNVLDKFSIWYKYQFYLAIVQGILTLIPFQFGDYDFTLLYNILSLPLEVISMFVMGTVGKFLFSRFSGFSTPGTVAVSACQLLYSMGTMILSLVGFLLFYMRTHGYGVFYE